MNNFFTDELIITQLCKERTKLAERRDKQQYLTRLIGGRSPRVDSHELDGLLPPRRHWSAFRPKSRFASKNPDLPALRYAVNVLQRQQPGQPWVQNLNRFIADTKERALGYQPFIFAKPDITWLPKPGSTHEYRALCRFSLQDNLIACLVAQYIRDQLDPGFSPSSYAFRARNSDGRTPTHHDAFNHLYELRQSKQNKDLFAAECDIRGFFDTVDHSLALAAYNKFARHHQLHPRARQIFQAYLAGYNFNENIVVETEPRLKLKEGANAHFPWPKEALFNPESRILGIPQGGALSGVIANLILDAADKAVERQARQLDAEIHYYRYCDDMILLSPSQKHCEQVFAAYLGALDDLKLAYHNPAKTWLYGRRHWKQKSKAPYCWTGRKWFGCAPWIQFVGYQVRYDGLARSRKGAFKSQAEKFVAVTNDVKFGLLQAGKHRRLLSSRFQVMRSFAHKLTAKGVGIVEPYVSGPRPMSWSAGFQALHQKPIVTTALRSLDRLRQKQIQRFSDANVNYGTERSGSEGWNPTGYWQSYFSRFKNVGGRQLINNLWSPRNWKEYLQSFIFSSFKQILTLSDRIKLAHRRLKKRSRNLFRAKIQIEVGELWIDRQFRRNHLYEVLEVEWRVKCRNVQTNQIRYIPKPLFAQGRYVRRADSKGRIL